MAGVVLLLVVFLPTAASFTPSEGCRKLPVPELVYSFVTLDYDFGSKEKRQAALESGKFIRENNVFKRAESYKGDIYVSVPRILSGVPFTLVKLVEKADGRPILEPFPGEKTLSQQPGNCYNLISSSSFNIDVHTDTMWVIDSGRVVLPADNDPYRSVFCPAKLLAIKVSTRHVVYRHIFPEAVVPRKTGFLADLVLDYVDGKLAFIYISTFFTLVVFDVNKDQSFVIEHPSFLYDPEAKLVPFPGNVPPLSTISGINGMAVSCDFRFFYYRSITGFHFYRVPIWVLRTGGRAFDDEFQNLGRRNHIGNGMVCSTKNMLYYAALNDSALDRFLIGNARPQVGFQDDSLEPVQRIVQDFDLLEFPDSLAINEKGYLYFTASRANRVFENILDIKGKDGTNFHIWRLKLGRGERSYLWKANRRTASWRKRVSRRCDRLY